MRILFYISTIRGGGAARVMANLANGFADGGNEVLFITNFPAEHEYSLNGGIRRFSLEQSESRAGAVSKNMKRILALRGLIKRHRPDVCVSFMRENNFRLIIAAAGLNTKTVVSVRNDPSKEYPDAVSRRLAELLYKRADGTVFQTEDARAFFSEPVQARSAIIFNQVDDRLFQTKDRVGEYILACGRLSKQKNYPMMLRAFALVLKKAPDEKLRIYGEGPLMDELRSYAGRLGLEQSVSFEGYCENMADVYAGAKLLLLSSDYEGIPNTMLEAMASSVPVIATDCPCGGPAMVIKDGVNGYLSDVGREDMFADRVLLALSNLCELSIGACKTSQSFRGDVVLKKWNDYIRAVLRD